MIFTASLVTILGESGNSCPKSLFTFDNTLFFITFVFFRGFWNLSILRIAIRHLALARAWYLGCMSMNSDICISKWRVTNNTERPRDYAHSPRFVVFWFDLVLVYFNRNFRDSITGTEATNILLMLRGKQPKRIRNDIQMHWCKTAVFPLLTHWGCWNLMLNYRYHMNVHRTDNTTNGNQNTQIHVYILCDLLYEITQAIGTTWMDLLHHSICVVHSVWYSQISNRKHFLILLLKREKKRIVTGLWLY